MPTIRAASRIFQVGGHHTLKFRRRQCSQMQSVQRAQHDGRRCLLIVGREAANSRWNLPQTHRV
ncbi:MAG TPA: hypothetical protein PLR25_08410 [Planctomycetaceae bacterium]|nr:hypothetical protein [Planctomycetaceae bacterium]